MRVMIMKEEKGKWAENTDWCEQIEVVWQKAENRAERTDISHFIFINSQSYHKAVTQVGSDMWKLWLETVHLNS